MVGFWRWVSCISDMTLLIWRMHVKVIVTIERTLLLKDQKFQAYMDTILLSLYRHMMTYPQMFGKLSRGLMSNYEFMYFRYAFTVLSNLAVFGIFWLLFILHGSHDNNMDATELTSVDGLKFRVGIYTHIYKSTGMFHQKIALLSIWKNITPKMYDSYFVFCSAESRLYYCWYGHCLQYSLPLCGSWACSTGWHEYRRNYKWILHFHRKIHSPAQ